MRALFQKKYYYYKVEKILANRLVIQPIHKDELFQYSKTQQLQNSSAPFKEGRPKTVSTPLKREERSSPPKKKEPRNLGGRRAHTRTFLPEACLPVQLL